MRRREGSRGASVVEVAFALPIFFFLVLGLVDFGVLALESNQAENAARDGARVGIIKYRYLDSPATDPKPSGSKDLDLLRAQVEKNLPGRSIDTLEVFCSSPTSPDTPKTCLTAEVDRDLVRVRVGWNRESISPVSALLGFDNVTVEGIARMTIVGEPVAGGPASSPDPCDVTGVTVTPSSVNRTPSGTLAEDLVVDVARTGLCDNLNVRLIDRSGSFTDICVASGCATTTYVGSTNNFWTGGTATAAVTGQDTGSTTFTVVDPAGPPPCTVSVAVAPNPTRTDKNDVLDKAPAESGNTKLRISITRAATCTNVTAVLRASNNANSVTLCTTNCAGDYLYSGNDKWWPPGSGSVSITGNVVGNVFFTVQPPL